MTDEVTSESPQGSVSVISDDVLSSFGIDTSAFGLIASAPEEFVPVGRTLRVRVGARTDYMGSINGNPVEASVFVHEYPLLSRVTVMRHKSPKAPSSAAPGYLVTGMIKPIRLDHTITLPDGKGGNQTYPLEVFCLGLANQQITSEGNQPIDMDRFLELCSDMGIPFKPVEIKKDPAHMTMMWQHFSPNMTSVNALIDLMLSKGAKDVTSTIENPGRMERVVAFETGGLPLEAFEVGRQDRRESQWHGRTIEIEPGKTEVSPGQGFLDLTDAAVTNFQRGMQMRKIRRVIKARQEALRAKGNVSAETEKAFAEELRIINRLASSWMNSVGGAQRRASELAGGKYVYEDIFDSVQVPCGFLAVKTGDGPEDVREFDLWTSREGIGSAPPAPTGVVDTTLEGSATELKADGSGTPDEPF